MKPVLIVGSGISGMSLAYWLTKLGVPCKIVEKSNRVGGLISTEHSPFGLIESAANGFMGATEILEMIEDLDLPLANRKPDRKVRFIFRDKPTRWPLSFLGSCKFIWQIFCHMLKRGKSLKPVSGESISQWTLRCFSEEVLNWLVAPALQGIYAGRVDQLSASLVLGRFFKRKSKNKTRLKGTLSPQNGMGQWTESLNLWLKARGTEFSFDEAMVDIGSKDFSAVVIATSAWAAFELKMDGKLLLEDFDTEALPLVSVTAFFEGTESDVKGFGCLFPKSQGFYSLGVLFNDCIFENRTFPEQKIRSETWIFGGAMNKDILRFSDAEILRQLKTDRKRLHNLSEDVEPQHFKVTRWPKALPHITVELEKKLAQLSLPEGVYLTGNYLGSIGLSQIVSRNKELATIIYARSLT